MVLSKDGMKINCVCQNLGWFLLIHERKLSLVVTSYVFFLTCVVVSNWYVVEWERALVQVVQGVGLVRQGEPAAPSGGRGMLGLGLGHAEAAVWKKKRKRLNEGLSPEG